MLDTAAAYGDSEAILGRADISQWQVITKIPSLKSSDSIQIEARVREHVEHSLDRLRINHLHAVLAHDPSDLSGSRGEHLSSALSALKDEGRVMKIGGSVYSPDDCLSIVDGFSPDIIQAPFNVFDQRLVKSGYASAIAKSGGEFHARSIFLQGLLLMSREQRPVSFDPWQNLFAQLDTRARRAGLSHLAYCLGFALARADIARCVVGVDGVDQLSEVVEACKRGLFDDINVEGLATDDAALIDPRRWQVTQ